MVKRCGWVLFVGPLCVFNYNIIIKLWVMETENSQNMFSISITHNSKIRKLSDRNRVMEIELWTSQTTFLLWVLQFLSYELWKLKYEWWKLLNQTSPKYLCPMNLDMWERERERERESFIRLCMVKDGSSLPADLCCLWCDLVIGLDVWKTAEQRTRREGGAEANLLFIFFHFLNIWILMKG